MKKVKIYTYSFNRPDFIPLQRNSFIKCLKDDFELIVFNNARDQENQFGIKDTCDQMKIKCIDVDGRDNYPNPSGSHGHALDWSFHHFIKFDTNTIAVLMDSDMFMVNEFSVNDYLGDYDVAAVSDGRKHINYLHPGLMFFNIDSLPHKDDLSFMCGIIDGVCVDTGGHLYYWLQSNPELRILRISTFEAITVDGTGVPDDILRKYEDINKFLTIEKTFLHYIKSSNYDSKADEYHHYRTNILKQVLS